MLKKCFIGAALLCVSVLSLAHDYTVGELHIKHPWTRASASGATNAGAFMVIKSASNDQLLQVSGEIANKVEIHEMKMVDGVMKMRPVSALPLAAGTETKLAPGTYHIMLMGLKQPLKEGEKFPLTLTFAKAGVVTVQVKVEAMTYQAASAPHSAH
jgi:copper(I)-binding protein